MNLNKYLPWIIALIHRSTNKKYTNVIGSVAPR